MGSRGNGLSSKNLVGALQASGEGGGSTPTLRQSAPIRSPTLIKPKNEETPTPSSDTNCPICFEEFTNKSYTNNCPHQFCFSCLKEWASIKPECPMCKRRFSTITHNIRPNDDFQPKIDYTSEPSPMAGLGSSMSSSSSSSSSSESDTQNFSEPSQPLPPRQRTSEVIKIEPGSEGEPVRPGDIGITLPRCPLLKHIPESKVITLGKHVHKVMYNKRSEPPSTSQQREMRTKPKPTQKNTKPKNGSCRKRSSSSSYTSSSDSDSNNCLFVYREDYIILPK